MSSNSFESSLKTKSKVIDQSNELKVQLNLFSNKIIIIVSYNGEIDSAYHLKIPNSASISSYSSLDYDYLRNDNNDGSSDDLDALNEDFNYISINTMPVCLMGDPTNLKLQILSTQVLKLMISLNKNESRNIIIQLSSKIFKGSYKNKNDVTEMDFDVLYQVLDLFKQCYLSK
ncbi:Irc25p ASCRUDRAFT_74258 [Ascoidea rubescens DSM 1968]|uniref:Proteasome assembly chaperone 3 n=1 Tax=Ascoidea rubescens DSM 1968 TaxID=1344418 RepID=A0A1D2VMJ6_9ASCO|nr:hypothetical protein ASCRUDRAFT_74258 [Ascoidea rubescens DSM 1968]ODV62787.1 hypothetical protein ASCRUDRAFT_74258 [Ascoidea rubescens DSM 1968]